MFALPVTFNSRLSGLQLKGYTRTYRLKIINYKKNGNWYKINMLFDKLKPLIYIYIYTISSKIKKYAWPNIQ